MLPDDLGEVAAQARKGKLAYIRSPALDDEYGEGNTSSPSGNSSHQMPLLSSRSLSGARLFLPTSNTPKARETTLFITSLLEMKRQRLTLTARW